MKTHFAIASGILLLSTMACSSMLEVTTHFVQDDAEAYERARWPSSSRGEPPPTGRISSNFARMMEPFAETLKLFPVDHLSVITGSGCGCSGLVTQGCSTN